MKVITVNNRKGGAAKTTTCIMIGCELVYRGYSVAMLDTDEQQTLVKFWARNRDDERLVVRAATEENLPDVIEKCRQIGFDFVVIDTPPTLRSLIVSAARQADLIIVPGSPSSLDVDASLHTYEMLRVVDPGYSRTVALLSICPPTVRGRDAALTETAQAIIEKAGITVCPVKVGHRMAYKYAVGGGEDMRENAHGRAAGEQSDLTDYVLARLGMESTVHEGEVV